ncbi:hypothetical protein [Nocardia sp. NPDC057353]|uniref:hypothetical protein n=1 Tax=Nocardia sp. NPDC057353 TaxID=3346104 RepID=UPI00363E3BCE
MLRTVTRASAVTAIALAAGALAAPAALAEAPEAKPIVGSVAVCINIPVPPPVSINICL